MKKILILLSVIFVTAGCSNMLVDLNGDDGTAGSNLGGAAAVPATTDINGDGTVDAADTAILAKLTFTVTGDTVTITDADPDITGVLNIPATYDGKTVTSILDSAFSGCSSLTSITVPADVTEIGELAFSGCTGLISITMLPTEAPIAAANTLSGVSTAVSLTYPDGATGYDAGGTIWVDTSVLLKDGDIDGDGVVDGDDAAFISDKLDFSLVGEEYVLIDVDTTVSGRLSLPATFNGKPVTGIGTQAFMDCIFLTSITIPSSVITIEAQAFRSCSSLESITIPDSVTSLGDYVFLLSTNIETVTIFAESAPTTGLYLFYGTTNPINIRYPDGASGYGASPWEEARIGDLNGDAKTNSVDVEIFSHLTFTETATEVTLTNVSTSISEKLLIPPRLNGIPVTVISDSAFENNTSLESITVPESVITIGDDAFKSCINLNTLTMLSSTAPAVGTDVFNGTSNSYLNIPSGATGYDKAPWNNSSIFHLVGDFDGDGDVDGDDTIISDCLIFEIKSDTEITLTGITDKTLTGTLIIPYTHDGRRVTLLDGDDLRNCISITSVIIPDGVARIGSHAFYGWTSLESVTLPSGKLVLSSGVFSGCTSLTSISLSSNCWSIGSNVFEDCSALTSIIIPSGITAIDDYTFQNCSSLSSVTLPSGLISLGRQAFEGCSSLTSIVLPSSINDLGYMSFKSCTSLTTINLPSGITSIESQQFNACHSLESIDIPAGVTEIKAYAFLECTSLKLMTMRPSTAPIIGDMVFGLSGCTLRIPTGAIGYDVEPWTISGMFTLIENF